jgi:diguanylate cyclase (GGDEF)-like protein/PAS domain S-box-containing protein
MRVSSSAARFLVVADDPLVASTIGAMLRSIVASPAATDVVDTAARAVEALEREVRYSAIVLDVDLPDGNGLETVRNLRAVDAVPVIVLTSHDRNEIWGAAADAGAAAVLPKSALTADRLAAVLTFAREKTIGRQIADIVGRSAVTLLGRNELVAHEGLLEELRAELGVDALRLTISPTTEVDDGLAVVVSAGGTERHPVRLDLDRRSNSYSARLEVECETMRHLHHVQGSLSTACGLVLAGYELEQSRRALEANESRYRALADHSPDPVLTIDGEGRVCLANPAFLAASGLTEALGHTLEDLAEHTDLARVALRVDGVARRMGREHTIDDEPCARADGTPRFYSVRAVPEAVPGSPSRVHVIFTDTTRRVEEEHRLGALALTDPLTGLANRRLALDRLQHALDGTDRSTGLVVAAMLDMDFFKNINDLLGHQAGDRCLKAFAQRLSQVVRAGDTVARLGGDEFLVILRGVASEDDLEPILQRLHAAVCGPVSLTGREIELRASLGYAVADRSDLTAEEVLGRADRALYDVKRRGRGDVARYDGAGPLFGSTAELTRQLRNAFDEEQFLLRYQPIVHLDGRMSSAEALIRWDHPELGERPPADFIGEVIDGPLATPLARWVITTALEQLAEWRRSGLVGVDFTMHVNIAPQQLPDVSLVQHVISELERIGIEPACLVLEVTEQALFELDHASSNLKRLEEAGVQMYLDDFGTGASSLSHLRSSILDGLKIDRSFLVDLEEGGRDTAIVEGLIALAASTHLDLIAEGIERTSQRDWFAPHPTARLQGYLFGRPERAEELERRF